MGRLQITFPYIVVVVPVVQVPIGHTIMLQMLHTQHNEFIFSDSSGRPFVTSIIKIDKLNLRKYFCLGGKRKNSDYIIIGALSLIQGTIFETDMRIMICTVSL